MFTGLIESVGTIARTERTGDGGMRLEVYAPDFGRDMAIGDSVAVDGACLTVVSFIRGAFLADLSEETVTRTTLGRLKTGGKVNLERAMRLSDRLGGHLVSGHVDGIGQFSARLPAGNSTVYQFRAPVEVMPYIAEKGSVAVAGISLTVSKLIPNGFECAVIPHTETTTTLVSLNPGTAVNVEADQIAKYVRRFVAFYTGQEDPGDAEVRRGLGDMLREFTVPMTEQTNTMPGTDAASTTPFVDVETAIADIAAGRMVIVTDDEDRENEGDFVMAASKVTPEAINFMATNGRGLICLPLAGERLDELHIPVMASQNTSEQGTAFHVSIGAKGKITTGISAADRAATVLAAIDPATRPEDISMPGHVFPLRARPGGVLERAGHTEAAVDLARMAGLPPAGVICEIMNADGTMARRPQLEEVARRFGLNMVTVAAIIRHRRLTERLIERAATVKLPTRYGDFTAHAYRSHIDDKTHVALTVGHPESCDDVLVRVHSECLTGDVFHSLRCDCGDQLEEAMRRVQEEGCGVILYIVGHEGRGIGLLNKFKAYELQEQGRDTVQANEDLGFPADLRDYGIGAQILADLGLHSMRLMTNNPTKIVGLEGYGLTVTERVPIEVGSCETNADYMRTKRDKMDHALTLADAAPAGADPSTAGTPAGTKED